MREGATFTPGAGPAGDPWQPTASSSTLTNNERYFSAPPNNEPIYATEQYKHARNTGLGFATSPRVGQKRRRSGIEEASPSVPAKRRKMDSPNRADSITCGLSGCGDVIEPTTLDVSKHISRAHPSGGSSNKKKVVCNWINPSGRQCKNPKRPFFPTD